MIVFGYLSLVDLNSTNQFLVRVFAWYANPPLHTTSNLYKVIAVIHCPHKEKPQYVAEVYAIETEETIDTLISSEI